MPAYDEPGSALSERGWSRPTPGTPRGTPTPQVRPDGDVELEDTAGFVVPDCSSCGGVLKPDVVFFGENVPPERVQRCYDAVDGLTPEDALLVVGSSLTVMSGFRFVRRAAKAGVPVVIVNRGTTRGDELATVKVDAGCSEFLSDARWGVARVHQFSWKRLTVLIVVTVGSTRYQRTSDPRDEDVARGLEVELGGLASGADQDTQRRWR